MTAAVDLVVNCWERTYRDVLSAGYFAAIEAQCGFRFAGRVATINNVDDEADAVRLAEELLRSGELTRVEMIRDHLPDALARAGMTEADLGDVPHYTAAPLVAVMLDGSPWLVYWDAEVYLLEPVDWITPSLELMQRDARVLCANPDNAAHRVLEILPAERLDGFGLAPGFSDQLFLVRRRDLTRPVYGERCIAALRDPVAHLAWTFEMRVDSYMRHSRLLRASYLPAAYVHPEENAGLSHPRGSRRQRLLLKRNLAVVAYLRNAPLGLRPRCARDLGMGA